MNATRDSPNVYYTQSAKAKVMVPKLSFSYGVQSLRNKRNKMASGPTIRVCVLEGQYTQLSNLGISVSLAVEYSKVAFA